MLLPKFIAENKDLVTQSLITRNWKSEKLIILDEVLDLDNSRKSTQTNLDGLLSQINSISKEIGACYKSGKIDEATDLKSKVAQIKEESKLLEENMRSIKEEMTNKLLEIPNIAHQSVPNGKGEEDNEVYQAWDGELPTLMDGALPHWDLADKYNLFSLKLGVKLTGAGFPVFRNQGARLERALINFFLDEAINAGYEEIIPPLMVNEDSARGTGQLPDKEGQMYYVEKDNLYLIPTAEVPVTNIMRDTILKEDDFPIKMTAYSQCFRREAGSYGADVKGLNRVHQFDKVEIVQVQHPDKSHDALTEMCNHVEGVLKKLELPYRILKLCGGDLGFTSSLTYDFEVFSAAQQKWLEVSSVSNFLNYQTNRLKLRYKDTNGKTHLAHTLNGSALALPRIMAALLENHQTIDGIRIPKALQSYTRFDLIK